MSVLDCILFEKLGINKDCLDSELELMADAQGMEVGYRTSRRTIFSILCQREGYLYKLRRCFCVNTCRVSNNDMNVLVFTENLGFLSDTRTISLEEQLAYFLFIVRQQQSHSVTSEVFDRSNETINKYFNKVLDAIIKIHSDYIKRPSRHIHSKFLNNPLYYPYFKDCIGVINGTHIKAHIPLDQQERFWNKKGFLSQNVMVACTFDMQFTYVLTGWEVSASDSHVKIVIVCCILHNYIRKKDYKDIFENEVDDLSDKSDGEDDEGDGIDDDEDSDDLVDNDDYRRERVEQSERVSYFRDMLATQMWLSY
ncbi:uncharacterized protein [Aristolochia californica]|uniref:uncharacterized protein n=1 Tax=Aristolochia californica TaxID=171875 RepID=UPI0035DEEDA9